jgi:hypothetical protein
VLLFLDKKLKARTANVCRLVGHWEQGYVYFFGYFKIFDDLYYCKNNKKLI